MKRLGPNLTFDGHRAGEAPFASPAGHAVDLPNAPTHADRIRHYQYQLDEHPEGPWRDYWAAKLEAFKAGLSTEQPGDRERSETYRKATR